MATKFHRVLLGTELKRGFLQSIELSKSEEAVLRGARDAIRHQLTLAFGQVSAQLPIQKRFLVEGAPPLFRTDEFLQQLRPVPRFREQGSHAYRTLNDPVPAHTPPQQIDLDDGMFLPTSFVNEERPAIAAKAYFRVVEEALRPLCRVRGWTLCDDKPSCVRVLVSDKIHIDLPLYALPDNDYVEAEKLEKALESQGLREASAEFAQDAYASLPEDHIMLAKRDGSWLPSDPRKLSRWFQDAVNRHGPHLRHACRYLKAWRDFSWIDPDAGISSIILMAVTVKAFDESPARLDSGSEDGALLAVTARMPELLNADIPNPVIPELLLDGEWTRQQRKEFVEAAQAFHGNLAAAKGANSGNDALAWLTASLGDRVPTDPSLVEVLPSEEAAILSQPRRYVPAPSVGRSVSG